MWRVLRAELVYFSPWLLGGLGMAAGISVLLSVLLRLFGGGDETPSFLPGMFALLAGMVVSFIAQSYRFEEHRARLLMAAPLTTGQLAGVMVLLPVCLVGLGALAAPLILTLAAAIGGQFELRTLGILGVLAGQFMAYAAIGPLAQEAVTASKQGRTRAAVGGWAVIGISIPLLTALFWLGGRPAVYVPGFLVLVASLMAASVRLYRGRTDFTR